MSCLALLTWGVWLSAAPAPLVEARIEKARTEAFAQAVGNLMHVVGEYPEALEEGEYKTVGFLGRLVQEAAQSVRAFPPEGPKWARRLDALVRRMPNVSTSSQTVSELQQVADALIRVGKVRTHPLVPPDFERGAALYASLCAVCHGRREEPHPEAASRLFPMPKSFLREGALDAMSPFKAFTVMTHGVSETAMPSFELVPEADRWAVAFFLFTLREAPCEGKVPVLSWEELARTPNEQLAQRYGAAKLSCLRRASRKN